MDLDALAEIQGKTRDDMLRMCQEYVDIFQKLAGFIQSLESKLPYFKADQPKMSTLIQEYHAIKKQLEALRSELEMFHSLEDDEKAMVFLMGGQNLARAKKYSMEFSLKLIDTDHGRQLINELKF